MSDLLSAISWWLVVEIIGLAALPLALRWLRWLPDRGYFFAKPLGILLVSYLLWLGASLSIVDNGAVTIALLVIAVAAAGWWRGDEALAFWRQRWRLVLGSEALFAVAFGVWALVRAYNPEIAATEKPMEIAFLSSALRSSSFPPVDPWLAGHGISYYYFGYVAMAMLARLAGVAAPVAFNLSIALLFAMTVGGAFALGYNLAAHGQRLAAHGRRAGERAASAFCGLLASLLVAVMANLEGLVELLNARGMLSRGMWQWLQIKDMPPPATGIGWLPADNWWWFRAARVIMDYDPVTNASRDYTINEFPFFSFLLGDLHPHVLALPFAVLAIAVALNLLYSAEEWTMALLRSRPWDWLLLGLVFGGLGFLNSWDMPAYLLLLGAAFGLHRYRRVRRFDRALLREVAGFGALVLLAGIVLYLPFYIGFRSQAQGLGFVLVHSKPQHFAIFWGPLLLLVVAWIAVGLRRDGIHRDGQDRQDGGITEGRGTGIHRDGQDRQDGTGDRVNHGGHGEHGEGLGDGIHRHRQEIHRGAGTGLTTKTAWAGVQKMGRPGGLWQLEGLLPVVALGLTVVALVLLRAEVTALLLVLLVLGGVALRRRAQAAEDDRAAGFVWLLVLVGLFLITICEWLFIRDYFNNRMNTVFKLYYQAWLMMAVAGAYVLYYFAIRRPRAGAVRVAWQAVAVLVLAGGLVYPVAATVAKTRDLAGAPTLDGQAFLARVAPADDEAIRWLQATVRGTPTILEATGGSYSSAGRVAAFTGLPTLLGWDFHELQWRGSYGEPARRKTVVETLYSVEDPVSAQAMLREYGVSYVYVGPLERERYGKFGAAALEKFAGFMDIAYQNDGVTIYRMRE